MVEQSSITQMARLMSIINDNPDAGPGSIAQDGSEQNASTTTGASTGTSTGAGDGVAAMKTILERFYRSADTAAETLVEETRHDRTLRDAMLIEQTDDGLTMGLWQIRPKTDSGRKLYDVIRIDQNQPIAQDLTLYEAARGLAHALNDGLPITSRRIRDLLIVEEDYATAVHNAIHAKHALGKQSLDEQRRAILEDKYGAAVRRGHAARKRIFAMVGGG